jgi:nucleoside-diphosphate-sugar epimerase
VYISSCSVYGVAEHKGSAPISETSALEPYPDRRGSYSASKQEAEGLVTEFMKSSQVPVVILRPGAIYGSGGDLYTGMMGFAIGSTYVVLGMGGFQLPLVYVDNVADAIALCLGRTDANGEIFNVVDPEPITKRGYMNRVIRRADSHARVLYMPMACFYSLIWMQEVAFKMMKRRPVLTRYRVASSQKRVTFDGSKLGTKLGWRPAVALSAALDRLVGSRLTRPSVAQETQPVSGAKQPMPSPSSAPRGV